MNSVITRRPVYAYSSDEAKWRQYEGSKLVFMSENTPPSFAIRDNIQAFYDLTGIEVEILTDGLPTVQQKVGIDLRSGPGRLSPQLRAGQARSARPSPTSTPTSTSSLSTTRCRSTRRATATMSGSRITWMPVASTTSAARSAPSLMTARCPAPSTGRTFFEQLTKDFEADYGYRLEFTDDTTYKNMVDIAEFFRKMHERDASIPYGYAQHHGSFGWTTQLDIQRHMYAQNQWLDFAVDDTLGSKNPGPDQLGRRPVGQRDGRLQGAR